MLPRYATFSSICFITLAYITPLSIRMSRKMGLWAPKWFNKIHCFPFNHPIFPEIMFPPWFQQKLRSHKARPKNLARSLARYRRGRWAFFHSFFSPTSGIFSWEKWGVNSIQNCGRNGTLNQNRGAIDGKNMEKWSWRLVINKHWLVVNGEMRRTQQLE